MIQYPYYIMKKAGLFIVFCAAIALILAACMEPVDHDLFLKDERILGLLEGNDSDEPGLFEDQSPDLELDVAGIKRQLSADEVISLSLSVSTAIIRVSNGSAFDPSSIKWYRNQTQLLATVSPSYDVLSGPIAAKGVHTLTVIAEINGILYNTSIVINVVD